MSNHSNRKLQAWQLTLIEAAARLVAARPTDFPAEATSANPAEIAMDVARHVILLANAMAALTIATPRQVQQPGRPVESKPATVTADNSPSPDVEQTESVPAAVVAE